MCEICPRYRIFETRGVWLFREVSSDFRLNDQSRFYLVLLLATARTISPGLELLIRRFTRARSASRTTLQSGFLFWSLMSSLTPACRLEYFSSTVNTHTRTFGFPRPGFVTQGFDSRCVVSSIKSRKSRRGSRARADATHRRSAAILAPLHISRDRNTGESTLVLACARRIARVAPGTCVAGDVPSRRTRRSEASRVSSFEMSPRDGPGSRRSRGRSDVYIA